MTRQEGRVSGIYDKDWQTIKLWSFKLDGSDRFWRLGRIEPEFKVGDYISFEERNSNVDPQTVEITEGPEPVKSSEVLVAADVGSRIRYQEARRDAVSLVVAALHTDALPWASNVAKNKKLDLLLGYVKQLTEQLLEEENKR